MNGRIDGRMFSISCLMSAENSLGHVGTVNYPNQTFPGQAKPKQ